MSEHNPNEIRIEKFCPNCGAPVNPKKPKCEYCAAVLPGVIAHLEKEKELDSKAAMHKMDNDHKERMRMIESKEKANKPDYIGGSILGLMFLALMYIAFKFMH